MSTLGERIRKAREGASMNQSELARAIGVKPQSIQALESGRARKTAYLAEIAEATGTPIEVLREPPKPGHAKRRGRAGQNIANLSDHPRVVETIPGYVQIERMNVHLGAGMGGVPVENSQPEYEWFRESLVLSELRARAASLRYARIVGASMEPDLKSGDEVLIDIADRVPSPPGIFMLWDGYGLVAKHVEPIDRSDPPRIRVVSANKIYAPRELTVGEPGDDVEAHIYGRVVWFSRRL